MGRSVSYPSNCTSVCFKDITDIEEQDDFEFFVDDLRYQAKSLAPSLHDCDRWVGREDHAILQNDHVLIGVSTYCGLAAIWMKAKDDNEHAGLSEAWANRFSDRFEATFGELRLVGRASNGEAFFTR